MIFGMTVAEFATVMGILGTFITLVATQYINIKKATQAKDAADNATSAIYANTIDREARTVQTLEALKPIATQVNDIHAGTGTGNGVTVNVPTPITQREP